MVKKAQERFRGLVPPPPSIKEKPTPVLPPETQSSSPSSHPPLCQVTGLTTLHGFLPCAECPLKAEAIAFTSAFLLLGT